MLQILASRFAKVIADYITWESLIDLDASTSSDEEGSSYSEGVRMSVFPYNCDFRKTLVPEMFLDMHNVTRKCLDLILKQ